MTVEENKVVAERMLWEVFDQKQLDMIDELVSDDVVNHSGPPGMPNTGRESVKTFARMVASAFPDSTHELQLEVAEGDLVVLHGTTTGTHKGEFFGIPPTGKRATWSETHIMRIVDGKIVEHWADVDRMSMMQQLGVIPERAQPR